MKKNNKTVLVYVIILAGILIQQNAQADFFSSLSDSLNITGSNKNKVSEADVQQQKTYTMKTIAIAKKYANVRSGPGPKNSKVGHVPKGGSVTVLDTSGNWIKIEGDEVSGWSYKPLYTITESDGVSSTASATDQPRSNVFYAGYSKDFQNVKKMMINGNLNGVNKFYTDREATILKKGKSKWQAIEEIGLLRWMERGTLFLDEGNVGDSVKAFTNAEDIINVRKQASKASDLLGSLTSFAAETVTGNEEFQAYPGEGYEKVLMLNYKSISYLLDGKRQSYNVARRAIDWQNLEQEKFREKMEEADKKIKEETQSADSGDEWKDKYKKLDKIAAKVPSAYVNPFGYYVTGMIQEFESKSDRSLKHNARIAYEKALKLNPKSKVLKQAVKDMKKKKSSSRRILHVVVANGFAPEKKMLLYNFPGPNGIIPIKLPIYEPVSTRVARIEVQTSGGKRLARLSIVADIEAISLRHQKDSEALRSLRVGLSIVRAVSVNQATGQLGIFGNLLSTTVNDMAAPDMRSWMSLPANLQAARLNISNKITKIKIVSFDAKGRRLASKTIKINKKSDAFVYARTIDKQIYVNASKSLWTAKN